MELQFRPANGETEQNSEGEIKGKAERRSRNEQIKRHSKRAA